MGDIGTLDLLAQRTTVHTISASGQLGGFRAFALPSFLQSGGASCLYGAVDCGPAGFKEDLGRLASNVPLGMVSEAPDACSTNKRKMAKTFAELPANILGVEGECGTHQGHRIIESREREMVGNVHAVHVTCTQTGHQNRLQAALKTLLHSDSIAFYVGPPMEEWVARNRSIAERTLLRRHRFVAVGMQDETKLTEAVDKFLGFWNGDWTNHRPSHFCQGCRPLPDSHPRFYISMMP